MRGAKLQVRVLSLVVVTVGLLDLLSRLVPPAEGSRIDALENRVLPALPHRAAGAAAVLGVILIVLGRGLLQRRSLALPLTVVVLTLSAATRVPQGPDITVVLSVLVAILLIRARGLFVAETWRGRGRTIARGRDRFSGRLRLRIRRALDRAALGDAARGSRRRIRG